MKGMNINMGYKEEFMQFAEVHIKNRENIVAQYKDYKPIGLDGEPYSKELKEESKRFWKEIDKLKEKYNIKSE